MTKHELDTVMEIVSKELSRVAGGTRGMSRDQFRIEINQPWSNIKEKIEASLTIE